MTTGGCFCDRIRVSYTGEPLMGALCHCLDCRKISGSTYSLNILVPAVNFKVEKGTPKEITTTADSGKEITSSFCGDCGTTLFRIGDWTPGNVIIKAGILDDAEWPEKNVPAGELFSNHRVGWVKPIENAKQMKGMGN